MIDGIETVLDDVFGLAEAVAERAVNMENLLKSSQARVQELERIKTKPVISREKLRKAASQLVACGILGEDFPVEKTATLLSEHENVLDLVIRMTALPEVEGRPVKAASGSDKLPPDHYRSSTGEVFRDPYGLREVLNR